jgi:hypothetical protein
MTGEEHNKMLVMLYAIYGGLHGLGLVALLILAMVVKVSSVSGQAATAVWITIFALMLAAAAFTVPPLIVACGFKQRSRWAKPVAYVSAVLSLVNIPLGTALSIYTFKFFSSEAGRKLYGGQGKVVAESELQDALHGAQPLTNWAKRARE